MEALGKIGFGVFGLAVLIGVAWLFSNNRRAVDWRLVLTGIALQIGFAALVLLVPLAVTSNRLSIRRLGKNWRLLHRLVYVAVSLAAVHYLLATKVLDATQAVHIGLVALLLGYRLVRGALWRPERRTA